MALTLESQLFVLMRFDHINIKGALVALILIEGLQASEQQYQDSGSTSSDARRSQSSSNEEIGYEGGTQKLQIQPGPGADPQQQYSGSTAYQQAINRGTPNYFGTASTFPVLDRNGRLSQTAYPSNNEFSYPNAPLQFRQNLNPSGTRTTDAFQSSANTPFYPSILGKRPLGMPTHFDPNLNQMLSDANQYTPEAQRASRPYALYTSATPINWRSAVVGSSLVPTEAADQGPLAPAPKSLMEQAGWWEYLALLFGDAGDVTALRILLHRLTQLAQLQLGPVEAGRVQAATAFLAHHFKPLLAASFQDFVYDPDYSRRTESWSHDPVFGGIIRRLCDQMDYFGARAALDAYFGPNSALALSYGMRNLQWLRLKLILDQIEWDLQHPNDLIGLWSSSWKLTVPQKVAILNYARDPQGSPPLDPNMPMRDLIVTRLSLIADGQNPKSPQVIQQRESSLEQARYYFAMKQVSGDLCKAPKTSEFQSQPQSQQMDDQSVTAPNQTGGINLPPTSTEGKALQMRVNDYCELTNITPNFRQFCQSGTYNSMPIGSLLSSANGLFDEKVVGYVDHLERLFWAFNWVGSCRDSQEALGTLTKQLKALTPRDTTLRRRKIPADVSDAVHVRLEYMLGVQQTCQSNVQLAGGSDSAHIFGLLTYQHLEEAFFEWERRFSTVAARLQGYPSGPMAVGSGDAQLLYQQARDIRIALLIYKYPRALYVPCLKRGFLTKNSATDLVLLNLAQSVEARFLGSNPDPLIPELSARSLYMRALFLAGRYADAARIAREIAAVSPQSDDGVEEILACTELCGSETRNPCAAQQAYDKLLNQLQSSESNQGGDQGDDQGATQASNSQSANASKAKADPTLVAKSAYGVGRELAQRLCRLSKNTAADAISLRYGKVLTTQATFTALKRIFRAQRISPPSSKSKLLPAAAESIIPWFGTLPPAPVDEILSFVSTGVGKLKFVRQVALGGVPLLSNSSDQNQSASDNQNQQSSSPELQGKILVLGKLFDSNYLTTASNNNAGSSTSEQAVNQPLTKIENGYFQLMSDIQSPNQGQQPGQGQQNQGQSYQQEQY